MFTSAVSDGGASNVNNTYNGPIVSTLNSTAAFNVQDSISLQAQTGNVTDSGFTNNFVSTAVTTSGVPEPAANILIGVGLLAIAGLTRRASRRKESLNI